MSALFRCNFGVLCERADGSEAGRGQGGVGRPDMDITKRQRAAIGICMWISGGERMRRDSKSKTNAHGTTPDNLLL